ncbi:hypothetical protein CFN17_18955 [Arthrobacter sp. PM3]|nr:hypothetical protein CFN17_18955 [Arthrobacter sp. PM3]
MIVGTAPLVPGSVLVEGPASRCSSRAGRTGPAALLLVVHSGPGAGTVVALGRGRFRIGRSGTEIAIPDAALSREHARLDVSDADVTIVDLGSANGTCVDGRKVRSAPVTTASSIRCGDSTMALRLTPPFATDTAPDCLSLAGGSVAEPLVVRGTAAAGNRAAIALAAALPLVAGIGLAVLTGTWMFLAFTAVSAVSVLVPVLSGRRQRRELKTAVAAAAVQDRERRRQAAPSVADLVLDAVAAAPEPARAAERASAPPLVGQAPDVWLRLGLADQRANVRLEPPVSGFRPPPLGAVPLTLDPAPAVASVHGPGPAVAGLVRSLILQLAGYPRAGDTCLIIHGPAGTLPLPARFLPGVRLSADEAATTALLAAGPAGGYGRGVLILRDTPDRAGAAAGADGGAGATIRSVATAHGWRVIDCSPGQFPGKSPGIVLGRRSTLTTSAGPPIEFVPDLVPPEVFDRFCRGFKAAGRTRPVALPPVPQGCTLAEVLPLAAADIASRWSRASAAAALTVPVGAGSAGAVQIDLRADGPHFLIAGTTGAGKSEFLRTFAAAIAASHPPERVNLLFIDFKGGSGLGPLTGLPHCVGMLTDLGAADVGRTLVSLRAEVRRREELLARAGAPDLATYESSSANGPAVPYLVIVVDEFRILVDDAPGALTELMRIAAIGRALGIHLVMATQRPQGALNADIRANVTTSVALRVQSASESFDVMGSGLAAAIPITRPGRAFLIRGAQAPEEFQTATLAPRSGGPSGGGVTIRTAAEDLARPQPEAGVRSNGSTGVASGHGVPSGFGGSPGSSAPSPVPEAAQDASFLVDTVVRLWRAGGARQPRRPVADPLPKLLPYPGPGPADRAGVRLGRVDLPEIQRVAELIWKPAGHGHLGLVGAEAVRTDAVLALTVDQLMAAGAESHLYVLDAAGAFRTAAASPRVGAVAGLPELRRAVRVLQRVAQEVTARLSVPAARPRPRLVLVLSGWGAWVSAFRAGPLAWAEDLVQDIVRDGPGAGVTAVVSGGRELVTSRFFAALPNRIFFPAGSTEEGRLAWPRLPALETLPGRVAVFGSFVPASRATAATGVTAATGHAAQLYEPRDAGGRLPSGGAVSELPFRIDALPVSVTAGEVLARRAASGPGSGIPPPSALLIGVGGDDLRPQAIRLPSGGVLAVLGGPGSGKTTFLAALPAMNPGIAWLAPPSGTDPGRYWSGLHAGALAGTFDRSAIALADDADLLSPEANSSLAALNSLGWRVIVTADFGPAFGHRVTLAAAARSQGRAVLIRPRGFMDAEAFGVRFEPEQNPPPGRAVAISDGRATPVQLATHRAVP